MISIIETIFSGFRNSIANVTTRRSLIGVKNPDLDATEKIKAAAITGRQFSPKPLASNRQKLGFKPTRPLRSPIV